MLERFVPLAATLVLVALSVGPAATPGKDDQPKPPLQLTVRVDRQSYRMSDNLTLETQLTNVSDSPVFVDEWNLCWNFARGLVLHVIDAKELEVRTDFLLDCVPPPPRAGDVYRFVKIDGGRFYGLLDKFPIHEIVNKPGEYDLDVSFESSLSASWVSQFLANDPISKLPLWTMEKPVLRAARIHIKVIP
jgi:hypothetical protein